MAETPDVEWVIRDDGQLILYVVEEGTAWVMSDTYLDVDRIQ